MPPPAKDIWKIKLDYMPLDDCFVVIKLNKYYTVAFGTEEALYEAKYLGEHDDLVAFLTKKKAPTPASSSIAAFMALPPEEIKNACSFQFNYRNSPTEFIEWTIQREGEYV